MSATTFNLSFFYNDICTLSGPNDPSWERYKLCDHMVKSHMHEIHDIAFFERLEHFCTYKFEGIFFNHEHGYCSLLYNVTVTDKREFNIFKLKGEKFLRDAWTNGINNYQKNESDRWFRYQKWISAEALYDDDY